MLNFLKKILLFLLPIVRTAVAEVAAEEITKWGNTKRQKRNYIDYAERDVEMTEDLYDRPRTMEDVDLLERDRIRLVKDEGFHDVLMVAFDVSGPNRDVVEDFLITHMPERGRQLFKGRLVNLDDFWIADDGSNSDCDSAVFVLKGNQDSARGLLARHGLAASPL